MYLGIYRINLRYFVVNVDYLSVQNMLSGNIILMGMP